MPKKRDLSQDGAPETKKRGRKPKEVSTLINSTDKVNVETDNIIIHLPIKTEKPELVQSSQYEAVMNEPVGFDTGDVGSSLTVIDETPIVHLNDWGLTPITNFNDVLDKFKTTRQTELEAFQNRVQRRNVEKCLIQLDECNKSRTWPTTTNICCWWDTHTFTGAPYAMPISYVDGVYYVMGIYCSPECMCASSFNDFGQYGDKWERYSLANMMYRRQCDDNGVRIKLAAPRQVLKKFGGHLSIEEFRANNSDKLNTYKYIMPPMTSLIPLQELTAMDKGYHTKTLERKTMLDDTTSYSTQISEGSTATDGLRLKRTKPLKNASNALERHMLGKNGT